MVDGCPCAMGAMFLSPSVLVVITNVSGTFSNANWTTTPDGIFVVALPDIADTYVGFILPSTLPAGASVVIRSSKTVQFSISNRFDDVSTNFLVNSPGYRTNSLQSLGQAFCDVNFNGVMDPIDPLLKVLVVITNLSGTFSNAAFSTNGPFVINLPHVADT